AGRAQGRLSTGRGAAGLDRADPGARLGALRPLAGRALRRQALAEHRLPAAGRDVPLTRADGLLATEDRQTVRRPRPHHRDRRDLEDRAHDPRGPGCVQPRARVDRARQASPVNLWTSHRSATAPVDKALSSPVCTHSATPLREPERRVIPVLHTPYDY